MKTIELVNRYKLYQHRIMKRYPDVDWFGVPCQTCRGIAQAKIVNSQTETPDATEHNPRVRDRDDRGASDGADRDDLLTED